MSETDRAAKAQKSVAKRAPTGAANRLRLDAAAIQLRRRNALELRMAGAPTLEIGRRLAADPRVNSSGEAYPMGYGSSFYESGDEPPDDMALGRMAATDIRRAVEEVHGRLEDAANAMRALHEARLDRMLAAIWPRVIKGELGAIDRALKIMERAAKLYGLDAPARLDIATRPAVPSDDIPARLRQLGDLWKSRESGQRVDADVLLEALEEGEIIETTGELA
jgi:hypothetical protein